MNNLRYIILYKKIFGFDNCIIGIVDRDVYSSFNYIFGKAGLKSDWLQNHYKYYAPLQIKQTIQKLQLIE